MESYVMSYQCRACGPMMIRRAMRGATKHELHCTPSRPRLRAQTHTHTQSEPTIPQIISIRRVIHSFETYIFPISFAQHIYLRRSSRTHTFIYFVSSSSFSLLLLHRRFSFFWFRYNLQRHVSAHSETTAKK